MSSRSTRPARSIAGMVLKPWDERTRTSNQLQPIVQSELNEVAGARIAAFQLPPLPGSQGLPVQFVDQDHRFYSIGSTTAAQQFLKAAINSGMFIFLDTDLKIDNPEAVVRDRPRQGRATRAQNERCRQRHGSMLGGGYVNYFSLDQRSYKVIPQVQRRFRLNTDQLLNYYVANVSGIPVPAVDDRAHHDQDGAGIAQSFSAAQQRHHPGRRGAGVAQADALNFLKTWPPRRLPQGYTVDYGGLSRQYIQESCRLYRHFRICARHHLSVACGIVRKFPRSVHHSGLGTDVDCWRADLRQPRYWRRVAEYLHRGRSGDLDGPDQQARDPDCRVRQRVCSATARPSARPSSRLLASGCVRF